MKFWNECRICNGPVERVKGKNPYWRHIDARDLDNAHGAVPKY